MTRLRTAAGLALFLAAVLYFLLALAMLVRAAWLAVDWTRGVLDGSDIQYLLAILLGLLLFALALGASKNLIDLADHVLPAPGESARG